MQLSFSGISIFQSTLSVRRATEVKMGSEMCSHISIHALREESDLSATGGRNTIEISIHALREESDPARYPIG